MLIHVYIDERPGRIRLGLSHLIPRVVRWCKVTEERKGFYNPAQPSQQTYSVWLCIDSGFNYTTKIYTGNLLSKRLLFTTYLWNINCFLRQTRVCWGRGLQLPKLLLNDIFEVWCNMLFFYEKRSWHCWQHQAESFSMTLVQEGCFWWSFLYSMMQSNVIF